MKKRYCLPYATEKASTWEHTRKNIGTLLMSLERLNKNVITGQIVWDCKELSDKIINTLRDEGWTINFTRKEESGKMVYIVNPPPEKDR